MYFRNLILLFDNCILSSLLFRQHLLVQIHFHNFDFLTPTFKHFRSSLLQVIRMMFGLIIFLAEEIDPRVEHGLSLKLFMGFKLDGINLFVHDREVFHELLGVLEAQRVEEVLPGLPESLSVIGTGASTLNALQVIWVILDGCVRIFEGKVVFLEFDVTLGSVT